MNMKTYQPGELIIAEGTFGEQTFLIEAGTVQIYKETGKQPIALASLGPGEVFGEMYLLTQPGFRSATAIAKTEVTLRVMSREDMEQALKETPEIVRCILETMAKRLSQTSQEMSLMKFKKEFLPFQKMLDSLTGKNTLP